MSEVPPGKYKVAEVAHRSIKFQVSCGGTDVKHSGEGGLVLYVAGGGLRLNVAGRKAEVKCSGKED